MRLWCQAALVGLFEVEGFRSEGVAVQERRIQNRLRQLDMDRRWIQGTFTYLGGACHAGEPCQACHVEDPVASVPSCCRGRSWLGSLITGSMRKVFVACGCRGRWACQRPCEWLRARHSSRSTIRATPAAVVAGVGGRQRRTCGSRSRGRRARLGTGANLHRG